MSGLKSKVYKDERGIVSILVVSILVITLSLIAIGFSKLADRELTQASDRELSTQAYYAAQSGLNDAIAYLSADGVGFPGCTPPQTPLANQYFSPDLSGGTGAAKYSCISIDTQPTELSATVSPGQPQLVKVSADTLQHLYIAWQNSTSTPLKGLPGANSLPPEDSLAANGATGVLRVGIYEVPNSTAPTSCSPSNTNNTNSCLSSHMQVYYFYPNTGGAGIITTPFSAGTYSEATGPTSPNGNFVNGNCKNPAPNPVPTPDSQPHYCNSEITALDGTNNTYYLYLTAQYQALSVSIQGTDGSNKPVDFVKSQATVDVTGQGADVIQRIRAKVNLSSQFSLPNNAVQSMQSLCKNFTVDIGSSPTQYGAAAVKENPDNACDAPTGSGNIVGGGTAGHP